jgi:hypothetical protein
MEAGAPRKATADTEGKPVIPFNEAAKMKPGSTYISRELRPNNYVKQERERERELKPKVSDMMVDNNVLQYASILASQDGEEDWETAPLMFTDDAASYFHQFTVASQEWWKMCVLYMRLSDGQMDPSVSAEREATTAKLDKAVPHMYATEYVLAMGLVMSSNVAQRAANMIMDLFVKHALVVEDAFDSTTPPGSNVSEWKQHRRQTLSEARTRQDRLFSNSMYTDDAGIQALGVSRLVRMIKVWYFVTVSINLKMAKWDKRSAGAGLEMLGCYFWTVMGLITIPEHKVIAALALISLVLRGDCTIANYQKLMGLLEHLLVLAGGRREFMFMLYTPFKQGLDTADMVNPTSGMFPQLQKWRTVLLLVPGCLMPRALKGSAPPRRLTTKVFHLFADAALTGAHIPALGGYSHGWWWSLPLTAALQQVPIAHLEFCALAFNLVMFVRWIIMDSHDLPLDISFVVHGDGLAAVKDMTSDAAKSPVMCYIQQWLESTPEFQRVESVLKVAHVFGSGNQLADAASRGYYGLLTQMCSQLGTEPTYEEVPKDLHIRLLQVLAKHRLSLFSEKELQPLSRLLVHKWQQELAASEDKHEEVPCDEPSLPNVAPHGQNGPEMVWETERTIDCDRLLTLEEQALSEACANTPTQASFRLIETPVCLRSDSMLIQDIDDNEFDSTSEEETV